MTAHASAQEGPFLLLLPSHCPLIQTRRMAGPPQQAEGSGSAQASGSSTARKTFELNNDVQVADPSDSLFAYSRDEERVLEDAAPWKKE